MHFYFTPEGQDMQSNPRPPVPNIIKPTPQTPLYPRPQDPSLPYFNTIPARYNQQYQEEPFPNNTAPVDLYQNNDFSAREFPAYPAIGIPHSGSPSFMMRNNRSFNNFQLESQLTPFGQVPEYSGFEMYREPAPESFQPPYVDDYICTDARLLADNQLKTKETTPYLRPDNETSAVVEPQSAPKGQIEHTEEAPPTSTFKVGGHGMKGWCEEDEKLLRKLAVQYKFDWKKIAKKFANKKYTPHFLKMRYKGHDEGPVPKRIKFSHTEDILIAKFFNDYGIDWDRMATHFPNRTPIMIKNRYYSYIRKNNLLEGLLKEAEKLDENQIEQAALQQVESGENDESVLLTNEEGESQSQTELSKEEQGSKSSSKEITLLKAQLKSLKSLYVITYKELNKLKSVKK